MMIRRAIRRLSRNRVLRKRLPAEFGGTSLFCSPEAMLSMWKPGWGSGQAVDLFEWVRRFVVPGENVWDLGANQGIFTFAAAGKAGPDAAVVAFEPDHFLLGLLDRTSSTPSSNRAEVIILPMAVGAEVSLATFEIAATDRTLNHLASSNGNPHTGGVRQRKMVPLATLDWLAERLPTPGLMKIDVEGAEVDVLEGGTKLLETGRPRIIIEVAPENCAKVRDIFVEHSYIVADVRQPDVAIESPAWNTYAVPSECWNDGK
ncbi:MAG: FkbM family methyltransferase [Candidatus Paceibacterota bacterium]